MAAALAAAKALQDPRVRAQLIDASSAMADGVRNWNARRATPELDELALVDPSSPPPHQGLSQKVASRLGTRKLERRIEKLSANVGLLRTSVGPDAAKALDEVEQVVDRLSVAVAMAANLPFVKRQKAHWQIASVLDELERALFSQALS